MQTVHVIGELDVLPDLAHNIPVEAKKTPNRNNPLIPAIELFMVYNLSKQVKYLICNGIHILNIFNM